MNYVINFFAGILGYIVRPCYALTNNYGLAVVLFVFISKLILVPLSVWVHKNSIKLVTMQPELNIIKANHYGDLDAIAEEQSKVYKKYKYNALASIFPLIVQIIILLGLVEVIENPGIYLPGREINTWFVCLDVFWVPVQKGGIALLVPAIAALSSWFMCWTQNRSQVLQSEQGKFNKYFTMAISVGLSLYLGFFVPAGVGLYWVFSNVFSIIQMYILNALIRPDRYVDYKALEESRKALAEIESLDKNDGFDKKERKALAKREKQDYKRFFSIINKKIVIYSEKSGFWKYYSEIVENLLKKTNLRIHYVTNDPDDRIFELAKTESRILPYYVGPKKIITLMLKLDADVVLMTTPDLNTYHIKRSYYRKDIEYIYTPHDPMSIHMSFREGSMDHFDTVLCVGPQQIEEIRETERVYGLPAKNLVPCGYSLLDSQIRNFKEMPECVNSRKRILIAPSWSEDNILDSVADKLIEGLLNSEYLVVVRPHPEYVKRYRARLDALMSRWETQIGDGLLFETDFSSNSSVYSSDILITDWSGVAYEYAYTTLKPVLFINTAMKVANPNWQKIDIVPLEISLRDKIGISLEKEDIEHTAPVAVAKLLSDGASMSKQIEDVRRNNIFNPGLCGEVAADYIIGALLKRKGK